MQGQTNFRGNLLIKINRQPGPGMLWKAKNALRYSFLLGLLSVQGARWLSRMTGIPTLTSQLTARLLRADGSVVNYGVVGYRVVTTAFVNFVVDQLQTETSVFGDFKYHDSGVGTTAEAVGNTDIETTDAESRVSGTQTEGASANIYRSVGTISYTTSKAITEHGLFNASTSGTLMDRTVFSAINVGNGDSIEFTYELTINSGG